MVFGGGCNLLIGHFPCSVSSCFKWWTSVRTCRQTLYVTPGQVLKATIASKLPEPQERHTHPHYNLS